MTLSIQRTTPFLSVFVFNSEIFNFLFLFPREVLSLPQWHCG